MKAYIDDKYLVFVQEQGKSKEYLTQFKQVENLTEISISGFTYTIVKRVVDNNKIRMLAMNEGVYYEITLNSVISDNGKFQSIGIRYASKDKLNFAFISICFEYMIPEMEDEAIERIKAEIDKPKSPEQLEIKRLKALYSFWSKNQLENGYDSDLIPSFEIFISRPSLMVNAEKLLANSLQVVERKPKEKQKA
jgi:hypothetical protein